MPVGTHTSRARLIIGVRMVRCSDGDTEFQLTDMPHAGRVKLLFLCPMMPVPPQQPTEAGPELQAVW